MWNPFRRKKINQSSHSTEHQSNRVDALANELQQEGRIKDLEHELERLDYSSLSKIEKEAWWHLYGIVAFQDGHDNEALQRFQEAYNKFPNSAQIRFSLGQQYIRTGDIEKGFSLFKTCRFPDVSREYALAQARYAYLWDRHEDGKLFLRPFFDAYKQVKILDDHFLYVRGLPFFSQWWSYLTAFAILSDDYEEIDSITKYVSKSCSDYDFDYLQVELEAYKNDKPQILLETLEKRLRDMSGGNFPTGYTRMNIAVIKSRNSESAEAAESILSNVELSEQDFPWLYDIRTLAQAEASHRLGDSISEEKHIKAFMTKQSMLFEPDIALNFHLLRYQEILKIEFLGK